MSNLFPLADLPQTLVPRILDKLPNLLRPAFKRVPYSLYKALLLPVLHSVFSEAINDGDFEFLQGHWLRISINDLGITWLISYQDQQLIMAPENSVKENVSFDANGDDLLLIAGRKEDPDTLFFQRRLKIEGDTELGLAVKNLIDAIDLEQLPSLAHTLVAYCAEIIASQRSNIR
ncbi:SCP2 domain-containing protein [Thalassotalea insulae]|uniref:Ubiquinone biosynthesis accessory factor UbiT n=1 Tax=Thalassotalea insulae TaxID=2056778 RepID=A0ABQ6GLE8_9GAMM|nr:SCP2 sterol-binding domain-containing protein [Thalassotalea insulae]GLX76838.1 SCP2 domain-containing protein [Thalassotalea insulae]